MPPLHFETDRVDQTALRASWFWATLVRFPKTWKIFSSAWDSKVAPDGLSFQWNEHGQKERTLGVEHLGRNIAPLHFKTEWVVENALRVWWFLAHLAGFAETWGIFSSDGDSKLTPDGLSFQWNGRRVKERTLGLELLGRSIAELHYKTERVAETALRASWFWGALARFAGTWGIFSSSLDSKLTPDGLSFQLKGDNQKERTLGVELLGRNIAPVYFDWKKSRDRLTRIVIFEQLCLDLPELGGYFPVLRTLK